MSNKLEVFRLKVKVFARAKPHGFTWCGHSFEVHWGLDTETGVFLGTVSIVNRDGTLKQITEVLA